MVLRLGFWIEIRYVQYLDLKTELIDRFFFILALDLVPGFLVRDSCVLLFSTVIIHS